MVALCQMQLAPVSLPHTHMRTAPRVKGPQKLGTRGELLRRSETICSQRARKVSATSPAEADRAARVLLVALCTYLELVLVWSVGAMLLRGPRTRDRAAVGESERRVRRSERERESLFDGSCSAKSCLCEACKGSPAATACPLRRCVLASRGTTAKGRRAPTRASPQSLIELRLHMDRSDALMG